MAKKLIFDTGKIELIAVLLILVVISSGCFGFLTVDKGIQEAVKKGDPSLCDDLDISEDEDRRDRCYQKVAEKIGDPSICTKIKDEYYWDKCYGDIAKNKFDINLCNEIKKSKNKDYCYSNIAHGKDDPSLCNNIKSNSIQGHCLRRIAVERGDANLCDDIGDKGTKDSCFVEIAKKNVDPTLCTKIENIYSKDGCYEFMAYETEDPTYCAGKTYRQAECYRSVATKTNNVEICDKIDEKSYIKNECISWVARDLKDPKICERIKDAKEKDRCKSMISYDKGGDISLCNEMTDKFQKELCIKSVAKQQNKPELCEDLEIYQDECWEDVAFENSQNSLCNKLDDTQKIYDCHFMIAKNKKDASHCLTIAKVGTKEKCIHNVAVTYKDVKVCANIQDLVLKNKCEDSTKLSKLQK